MNKFNVMYLSTTFMTKVVPTNRATTSANDSERTARFTLLRKSIVGNCKEAEIEITTAWSVNLDIDKYQRVMALDNLCSHACYPKDCSWELIYYYHTTCNAKLHRKFSSYISCHVYHPKLPSKAKSSDVSPNRTFSKLGIVPGL